MMGEGNVNLDVNEFIKETLKLDPSQAKINEVYEFFIEIHTSEMDSKCNKVFVDSKLKKCQYKRKGCSRGITFWNENLKNLFKNASDAERAYCRCKGSKVEKQQAKQLFKSSQFKFDKEYKKAKRAANRKREIELESLVGKNGREIWNLLDKIAQNLKRNRIPMEVYYYDDKIITRCPK